MKRKAVWIAAACLAVLLTFWLLTPQRAVREDFSLLRVERCGVDITERLSAEQLASLEKLVKSTQCARWRNPMGAFFLRDDTVVLNGMDRKNPSIHIYLVGSMDRYVIQRWERSYGLRNGDVLLETALEIIGDIR